MSPLLFRQDVVAKFFLSDLFHVSCIFCHLERHLALCWIFGTFSNICLCWLRSWAFSLSASRAPVGLSHMRHLLPSACSSLLLLIACCVVSFLCTAVSLNASNARDEFPYISYNSWIHIPQVETVMGIKLAEENSNCYTTFRRTVEFSTFYDISFLVSFSYICNSSLQYLTVLWR